MLIIDADSHITEPPDVFTSRVPSRYVDQVPYVVTDDAGKELWVLEGVQIDTVGSSAPAGFEGYPPAYPLKFADCLPAAYDAKARLQFLDEVGIWAQVLYPNVAGLGAQRFLALKDEGVRLACVHAYNDFSKEWISADERRLIANIVLPFWDVDAAVREIDRCLDKGGFKGILFTGEPQRFGLPVLGDHHWDPLYARAQEAGLPIHFHIGGGEDVPYMLRPGRAQRTEVHGWPAATTYAAVEMFMKNGGQCIDLVTSGALERFPTLNFVSVESGMGWVPFALDTADFTWLGATQGSRSKSGAGLLPSDLFKRQVYVTTWFEWTAPLRLMDEIPVDHVMFETDFPHTACLYRDVHEVIESGIGHAPTEVQRKILWDNAQKLYHIEGPNADDVLGRDSA